MLTTAEVRWFWRGHCPRRLHEWFFETGNPPGGGQSRTDEYIPQIDQPEISLKTRGDDEGLEIKGLVARTAWPLDALAPHVEIWCKWSCRIPGLRLTDAAPIPIKKTRWLRQFDTSNSELVEIPLGPDEKPTEGYSLPVQGCSAELTEVSSANLAEGWWTLGLEAFGDLETVPLNLVKALAPHKATLADLVSSGELLSYPGWLSSTPADPRAAHPRLQ